MGFFRWLTNLLGFGRPPQTIVWNPGGSSASAAPRRSSVDPQALDAGTFTPISDAELREKAGKLGPLWANPWFGRRDVIPPADDPRTGLIDRAMVAHGFLTAEELADIHAVGAAMGEYRPDPALKAHRIQQAQAESQAAREERKRQKQAAAAERKRLQEEAVAQRRRTDIVFLGRGVSKGLADRRAHVEHLAKHSLPVLATPADVAQALDIDVPRLRWLAYHTVAAERVHYVSFSVPKKNGDPRWLSAPHRELGKCQRWILENILNRVPVHAAAHGFVRGRSTVTAAAAHVAAEAVIGCDLEDFFPSITVDRVIGVFRQLGYSPAAATVLALLCTECPRRTVRYDGQAFYVAIGPRSLPQGACTSPAISNLVARRLDSRLSGLADKFGSQYTRYADDLTFSARGAAAQKVGWILAKIRHIVQDEGFRLHAAKTRVQRPNVRQTVTGVVVNERPGVPRKLVRQLRAILHRAQSEGLAAQNRENRPNFEAWLGGMVAYVCMVNPQQGRPLREAFERLTA